MTGRPEALSDELRATAVALQTYLAEMLQGDTSVLAEALRKFPGMLDDIAMRMDPPRASTKPNLAPTQFAEFLAALPYRRRLQ
jgi:hypothetical protein